MPDALDTALPRRRLPQGRAMIAIALLLAQAVPTPTDTRWEVVFEGPLGTLAIDPASISRTGDIVRMRRRTEYRDPGPGGMKSLVLTVAINCAARTYSMLRIEGYREDGSLIRGIDFMPDDPAAQNPFPRDDEAEALYGRSCRARRRMP